MKYIKGFDTLRAFAILIVIVEHWWIPLDSGKHQTLSYVIKGLIPDGGFGVDLFFVLSGFLITSILLNAINSDGNNKFRIIKNFMIRRVLRIFPVYYLTIILLFLVGFPFVNGGLPWFLLYLGNMLTFQNQLWNNFSHTWSLSVEEQFYLIWPWFIVFVPARFLKIVFLGALLIGLFTIFYTMKIQNNWAGLVLMPSCMQAFGLGGFYAYLRLKANTAILLRYISFLFPIALFLHFYWAFSENHGQEYNYFFLAINSIISVWLIHRVIENKSKWVNDYILENRVLNKIGQISYGLYLFHFVFGFVYDELIKKLFSWNAPLQEGLLDWQNAYFIKLVLLFSISLLSFRFFEKPIMNLKARFEY